MLLVDTKQTFLIVEFHFALNLEFHIVLVPFIRSFFVLKYLNCFLPYEVLPFIIIQIFLILQKPPPYISFINPNILFISYCVIDPFQYRLRSAMVLVINVPIQLKGNRWYGQKQRPCILPQPQENTAYPFIGQYKINSTQLHLHNKCKEGQIR